MIIGFTLLKMAGSACYSPQFNRGGLAASFGIEVTNWVGGGSLPVLVVAVEHRNVEDTSWSTLAALTDINSDGLKTLSSSPIKEILRLKFIFTGGVETTGAHLNVLAPQWRPY